MSTTCPSVVLPQRGKWYETTEELDAADQHVHANGVRETSQTSFLCVTVLCLGRLDKTISNNITNVDINLTLSQPVSCLVANMFTTSFGSLGCWV